VRPKRHALSWERPAFPQRWNALARSAMAAQVAESPRKAEKVSGTPTRVMRGRPAEEPRAFRANRSANESRYCARCARERAGGDGAARTSRSCSCCTSTRLSAQELDAGTSIPPATPIVPQERGLADHERVEQHPDLTRLFGGTALRTLHGSRTGQGRHLRILAAYTTRRLPSASGRRSWTTNDCPAGQRSVPSGCRTKSRPEKRPAFQGSATSGNPSPCGGEGKLVTSSCVDEQAGAMEVVRTGSG